MDVIKQIVELVIVFFYIGLFTIGGGLAAITLLLQEVVNNRGWLSSSQFFSMVGISESTPGPIGINIATYIGFIKLNGFNGYGILGAVAAVVGLVLPSLIIIIIIAKFFNKYGENKTVKSIMYGIKACVIGLICYSCFIVFKDNLIPYEFGDTFSSIGDIINIKNTLIFLIILALYMKYKKHPVLYIALGACLGIILL